MKLWISKCDMNSDDCGEYDNEAIVVPMEKIPTVVYCFFRSKGTCEKTGVLP